MKPLTEFLAKKREVTIQTLGNYLRQYVQQDFAPFWKEHYKEYLEIHKKAGDPTYGHLGRAFFGPALKQFVAAGYQVALDFQGELSQWGPPEVRERCRWSVVMHDSKPIGTLVIRYFYDQTQFRMPYAPDILALPEVEAEDIIAALLDVKTRLQHYEPITPLDPDATAVHTPVWEHAVEFGLADSPIPAGQIDNVDQAMMAFSFAQALSLWSRHGWELVNVVPGQGRLIAFFKRPVRTV